MGDPASFAYYLPVGQKGFIYHGTLLVYKNRLGSLSTLVKPDNVYIRHGFIPLFFQKRIVRINFNIKLYKTV